MIKVFELADKLGMPIKTLDLYLKNYTLSPFLIGNRTRKLMFELNEKSIKSLYRFLLLKRNKAYLKLEKMYPQYATKELKKKFLWEIDY